ncbi:MAG: hypothetical protein DSY42_04810 [Aquifex sp.]|nr:MAG: hypothetical protein DSY42_04810 [Aquifex sp.]
MRKKEILRGEYIWNVFAKDLLSKKKNQPITEEIIKNVGVEYLALEYFGKGFTAREAVEKAIKELGVKKEAEKILKRIKKVGREKINASPKEEYQTISLPCFPYVLRQKKIDAKLREELEKVCRKKKKFPEELVLKEMLREFNRKIAYGKRSNYKRVAVICSRKLNGRISPETIEKEIRKRLRKKLIRLMLL